MYDAIVIGAGPAGALAALLLARKSLKVLLLDRATFPRQKVCGDCLNPRIRPLLEECGLWKRFQQLPHHTVRGIHLERDGRSLFRQAAPGDSFRAVARHVFDHWLIQEACAVGAEFRPETTVTSLDTDKGIVTTSHEKFEARIILGADGRNSTAARSMTIFGQGRTCHRIGWQTTLVVPGADDDIHLNIFKGGYYGLVKINENESNLCLVLEARSSLKPVDVAKQFFPGSTPTSWRSIHPIERPPIPPTHGRLWLLGDASRVVEPFTGEGIFFAMASSRCAANLLNQDTLHKDPCLLASSYSSAHRDLYQGELLVNQLTRWLLQKSSRAYDVLPWLQHHAWFLRYATTRVIGGNLAITPLTT